MEDFLEIQSNLRRKKLHGTNQGSNFLESSFRNRVNVRAPVQFWRERQPQHFKKWFFLKNRPTHFHRMVKQKSWVFQHWNLIDKFLSQPTISCRSGSNSAATSLTYGKKCVGPRMEPSGTPELTGYFCEDLPFRITRSRVLLRKEYASF